MWYSLVCVLLKTRPKEAVASLARGWCVGLHGKGVVDGAGQEPCTCLLNGIQVGRVLDWTQPIEKLFSSFLDNQDWQTCSTVILDDKAQGKDCLLLAIQLDGFVLEVFGQDGRDMAFHQKLETRHLRL